MVRVKVKTPPGSVAIELGADDYITKPFNPQELGQRINLVLHRRSEPTAGVIRIDSVEIDLARRVLRKDGEAINLGANEWAIVYALVSQGRRPVSARDVLTAVWGGDYAHENEYLEIWIARLRKKVEADPGHPRVITGDARSGFAIGSATRRQMPESA